MTAEKQTQLENLGLFKVNAEFWREQGISSKRFIEKCDWAYAVNDRFVGYSTPYLSKTPIDVLIDSLEKYKDIFSPT